MLSVLEEMELDEVQEFQEEQKQAFRIEDLEQANWCLRKMVAYKRKAQEINELAQAEIERILNWQKKEIQQIDNSIGYFESLLQSYFLEEREKDPKFKLSTPYGKVTSKKQQPDFKRDDEKLLDFLKHNGYSNFVKKVEEPTWGELKKKIELAKNIIIDLDTNEVLNARRDESGLIFDNATGEVLDTINYKYIDHTVAIYNNKVIAGVDVTERADKIEVKAEG